MAKCTICSKEDWQNVDEYTSQKHGMCICMTCGFVTYPEAIDNADKVTNYYKEEYRPAPTVPNVFSGQRKLHFHEAFLQQNLFKKWKKDDAPVVFESGAAIGLFLDYIKKNYPKAEVYGTELTTTFRRVCWHQYKIKLDTEMDTSRKYDLIASYKVAEHIPDVNTELEKYFECLKDDGHLYISVPCWFDQLTNFGMDKFSIQYYYHKNHVNVWTRKLFETLLTKHGFEIIDQNHEYYDSTYLCKKNAGFKCKNPEYDSPVEIIETMRHIFEANKAYEFGDYAKAIQIYPKFPMAHIGHYEHTRQKWHKLGLKGIEENIINPALKALPNHSQMHFFAGDLCSRYSDYEKAIGHFKKALDLKPNNPNCIDAIANCFAAMAAKDPKHAKEYLPKAVEWTMRLNAVSFQHAHESVTKLFQYCAQIPMPGE